MTDTPSATAIRTVQRRSADGIAVRRGTVETSLGVGLGLLGVLGWMCWLAIFVLGLLLNERHFHAAVKNLLFINWARCIDHQIAAGLRLGECDDIADIVSTN
jgi:hypothetical protein